MTVITATFELATQGNAHIVDITGHVVQAVQHSGIRQGLACIFTPSSTSGITTLEYESGAVADLQRAFEELVPQDREYRHNLRWGDGNGHSHVRAALLGASFTVPVVDGRLTLGTWQQIVFVDFDVRPRRRRIIVQVVGEQG
ncbi:MAG: secondary thiamine-phosphate synthase enzyme YjbQ [Ardenticatenia bacterium]|nr:secondary thiamine-phosphate synthase enzyme YjbQ [Ardenticatenia bacterium]